METVERTPQFPLYANPFQDADVIHHSLHGLRKNMHTVNEMVIHRNLEQRREIRRAYQERYKQDLLIKFSNELAGDYESLLKSLFRSPSELLAHDIYRELKKPSKNSHELTNILCCCNNMELYSLKKAYATLLEGENSKRASHRSLETDVRKATKGVYALLLEELLKTERYEDTVEDLERSRQSGNIYLLVDETLVNKDVNELHAAMNDSSKTNPKVFIPIVTKRSKFHIKAIWEAYKKKYGVNIVKEIGEKFVDPFRTAINTIIMTQVDLRLLLICQLHEAMAGLGTKESAVNRIILLRLETDLPQIKEDYETYFNRKLDDDIRSDTSGDYRSLLCRLIGTPSPPTVIVEEPERQE